MSILEIVRRLAKSNMKKPLPICVEVAEEHWFYAIHERYPWVVPVCYGPLPVDRRKYFIAREGGQVYRYNPRTSAVSEVVGMGPYKNSFRLIEDGTRFSSSGGDGVNVTRYELMADSYPWLLAYRCFRNENDRPFLPLNEKLIPENLRWGSADLNKWDAWGWDYVEHIYGEELAYTRCGAKIDSRWVKEHPELQEGDIVVKQGARNGRWYDFFEFVEATRPYREGFGGAKDSKTRIEIPRPFRIGELRPVFDFWIPWGEGDHDRREYKGYEIVWS